MRHALRGAVLVLLSLNAWAGDQPPDFPFAEPDASQPIVPPSMPMESALEHTEATARAVNSPLQPQASEESLPSAGAGRSSPPVARPSVGRSSPEADFVTGIPKKPGAKAGQGRLTTPSLPTALTQNSAQARGEADSVVIHARASKTYQAKIARGQLNRIVTPFSDPKVLTVSALETTIEGNAVYVATESEEPISLFIADSDSSDAVSLELDAQPGAHPAEIHIEMERILPKEEGGGIHEPRRSANDPFVADIKHVLRALALGGIPQGFTLEDARHAGSGCVQPGIHFQAGQMMSGTAFDLVVYLAENNGVTPIVLDETACAGPGVVSMAAWPRLRLGAHEKAEVFVMLRPDARTESGQGRPSLLAP